LALKHFDQPNHEDRETLEAEEHYLEAQLALQLKTGNTLSRAELAQMGSEHARGGALL
jgi:hypothetical protein